MDGKGRLSRFLLRNRPIFKGKLAVRFRKGVWKTLPVWQGTLLTAMIRGGGTEGMRQLGEVSRLDGTMNHRWLWLASLPASFWHFAVFGSYVTYVFIYQCIILCKLWFSWWFQIFFYVHPYLGKIFNLTYIFQMVWIHQPVFILQFLLLSFGSQYMGSASKKVFFHIFSTQWSQTMSMSIEAIVNFRVATVALTSSLLN